MRTNPKNGNSKSGNISRAPRRRIVRPKESKKNPESVALTPVSEQIPIQDQIARLAYLLWEARGGYGGSAEDDWLRAEQEILARSGV